MIEGDRYETETSADVHLCRNLGVCHFLESLETRTNVQGTSGAPRGIYRYIYVLIFVADIASLIAFWLYVW